MPGHVSEPVGPVDGRKVPRFAGSGSFGRLPEIDRVSDYDVAVLGAPFDNGTSYRPGARFGPMAVRQASRHLRPGHHVELDTSPFTAIQVVDAGDVPVTPFSIDEAMAQIAGHAGDLLQGDRKVIAVGGDHTIALPMLRSVVRAHGPVALVHFDAHLDTWDTYFNAPTTHGTIFRRAFEEGLLIEDHSMHVGIRGPIYGRADLDEDRRFGFRTIRASDIDDLGVPGTIDAITERVADLPVYLSIDIDVLDPSFAPGTGTPEAGGLSSRELLRVLRGLTSLNLVSADLVEVAPAYDHAEITAIAAATVIFDIIALLARALRVHVRRVAGGAGDHLPGRHQLPDLPGSGADGGELRAAFSAGWRADAGDPVPGGRDDGGVQRAELVLAAPGSGEAAACPARWVPDLSRGRLR
jgi:agmatinase